MQEFAEQRDIYLWTVTNTSTVHYYILVSWQTGALWDISRRNDYLHKYSEMSKIGWLVFGLFDVRWLAESVGLPN